MVRFSSRVLGNAPVPGTDEAFDRLWPADFITEGQDQTRGWFYSQLGASTIAFDTSPYKSVLMHGFALDAEGRKMSKSLGNVVTPEEVVGAAGGRCPKDCMSFPQAHPGTTSNSTGKVSGP